MNHFKEHKLLIIIISSLVLLYFFRNQIEYFLYPYPRLTTILGMILTILIAYLGFYNQTKKENKKSEKVYLNIRKKLAQTYFEEKDKFSNHKLISLVYAIEAINKNKQEMTEPLKRDNIKYISEKHPNLYNSIQIFLDCIEKYEINNHLNNIIKEVNQHTTSSDSIYLKDKEQIKINNFIYNIKRFQLLILNHPNHLSFTKPDDLFREYHLLFSIITIISESENAEAILKNIIDFYSNNTEPFDV